MNTPEIKAIMGEQHVNQMTTYIKNGMMDGTFGTMMGGTGNTSTTGSAIVMGGTTGSNMMGSFVNQQ